MHKLIKEMLEKDFDTLNKNLVNGSDHSQLLVVLDTIEKVIKGVPYRNIVDIMCKTHPELNNHLEVKKATNEIIYILSGAHPIIKQCFEEDNAESPLGYRFALSDEIMKNVNFLTIQTDGAITINDVSSMSFISEVEALGRLSIIDQHEA